MAASPAKPRNAWPRRARYGNVGLIYPVGINRYKSGKWKGGRPVEFRPEVAEKMLGFLRRGCYFETAADAAGVTRHTARAWLHRGAQEDGEPEFRRWHEDVIQAMAASELDLLQHVVDAGHEKWQAAAWILERRHPERWGPTVKLTSSTIESMVSRLTDAELEVLADVIKERALGPGAPENVEVEVSDEEDSDAK